MPECTAAQWIDALGGVLVGIGFLVIIGMAVYGVFWKEPH